MIRQKENGLCETTMADIVTEKRWVTKNLLAFKTIYSANDPNDVPDWLNEIFIRVMDHLIYDCDCHIFPHNLSSVYNAMVAKPVPFADINSTVSATMAQAYRDEESVIAYD